MKLYKTIIEATKEASKTCSEWKQTSGDATYNVNDLDEIAGIHDVTFPNDSEDTFYGVFPDGEIAIINVETKTYSPIFIPATNQSTPTSSLASTTQNTPSADGQIRFCPECGSPLPQDAIFCDQCGMKVR